MSYIQTFYTSHRVGLSNMNGFKYATKIITIDCSKPIDECYSERLTFPKEYFDYPLSEVVNSTDNNKLRLKFQNSPFNIHVKTFVKKI